MFTLNTTHFKMIAQRTTDTHTILVAVVPNEMLGMDENSAPIKEFQAFEMPKTIYTGTYPTIKIDTDSEKPREDLKGLGIAGILTHEQWYTQKSSKDDPLAISLEKCKKHSNEILSGMVNFKGNKKS